VYDSSMNRSRSIRPRSALAKQGWSTGSVLRIAVVVLLVCCVSAPTCVAAKDQKIPQLLGRRKRAQARKVAKKMDIKDRSAFEPFFSAAAAADWPEVSNQYEGLRVRVRHLGSKDPDAMIDNAIWPAVEETYRGYRYFEDWSEELLVIFREAVLDPLPARSILLAGSDAVRFVSTAFRDATGQPKIFIVCPGRLPDNSYVDYLRVSHGRRIDLPSELDISLTFEAYIDAVRRGRITAGSDIRLMDGKLRITGTRGIRDASRVLTKLFFDLNNKDHRFFVEEGYVIPWMYPYLAPKGPLMELHPVKVRTLPLPLVKEDRDFWNTLVARLMSDSTFRDNGSARRAFAGMRAAIAGLYAHRKLYMEAGHAFREALHLDPTHHGAAYRYAEMMKRRGHRAAAAEVIETQIKLDPDNERLKAYFKSLAPPAVTDP
jgi:hypothetical protein